MSASDLLLNNFIASDSSQVRDRIDFSLDELSLLNICKHDFPLENIIDSLLLDKHAITVQLMMLVRKIAPEIAKDDNYMSFPSFDELLNSSKSLLSMKQYVAQILSTKEDRYLFCIGNKYFYEVILPYIIRDPSLADKISVRNCDEEPLCEYIIQGSETALKVSILKYIDFNNTRPHWLKDFINNKKWSDEVKNYVMGTLTTKSLDRLNNYKYPNWAYRAPD